MTRTIAVAAFLFCWVPFALAQETECAQCHEPQAKKLPASVHADLTCAGCHSGYEKVPHPSGLSKPKCADCHTSEEADFEKGAHGRAAKSGNQMAPNCSICHSDVHETVAVNTPGFRKSVPETCAGCHSKEGEEYLASVHGKAIAAGNFSSASCQDCHGEHTNISPRDPRSLVNPRNIRETCGSCHDDVRLARRFQLPLDRITSFDESFHGLAAKAGSQSVANCASCHGIHNILPSSDPKATTHQKNLPATCGKCHPGAGSRFAIGTIHQTQGQQPELVAWVRGAYLVLIPLTLGFMILHHAGDFIRKFWRLRLRRRFIGPLPAVAPLPNAEIRMHGFERLQHMLLVVSFSVLVWTGFALRYPDAWWAAPLVRWENVFPVRGTVHRVAAVVMVIVSILHVSSLIASRKLRKHWTTLWPRRKDVPEIILNTAYNLGLRKEKPQVSSHSYVEKMEYWAVVWGTAVMAGTGFLLWANRYTLAWLPKVWLDVADAVHFYEAVLATAAIVVWHFYSVILDPDVYPMDPAWLHGVSVRQRVREAHEDEDEPAGPAPEPEAPAVESPKAEAPKPEENPEAK